MCVQVEHSASRCRARRQNEMRNVYLTVIGAQIGFVDCIIPILADDHTECTIQILIDVEYETESETKTILAFLNSSLL